MSAPAREFWAAYAQQRAEEGRGYRGAELFALPHLVTGPLARQWAVRASSFDAFVDHVVKPVAARTKRSLDILDLGAGNGWLSYRMGLNGHNAVALDMREDAIDGLGAAAAFLQERPGLFNRVAASFDALPLCDCCFDIALFNASLHYAVDLRVALFEAMRVVRPGGMLVVLDSPFYDDEKDGAAMVREKRAGSQFGDRADVLLSSSFVEFLTRDRLTASCAGLRLEWVRRRVRYPLWYEARPLLARLRGHRPPSRFDLWTARVP